MMQNPDNPDVTATSSGTYRVFDSSGRLIGTITRPVERQPIGPGRETVFLARADRAAGSAAA